MKKMKKPLNIFSMRCAHSYLYPFQNENLFEPKNTLNDHLKKRKYNFKHMIYKWNCFIVEIIIIN
jgi:hypothetical protein